jgi:hypothetical protein
VLRGKALRDKYAEPRPGAFVVSYSQWDDKESYDAFRVLPQSEYSPERLRTQLMIDPLIMGVEWNTYRVMHTRSAS